MTWTMSDLLSSMRPALARPPSARPPSRRPAPDERQRDDRCAATGDRPLPVTLTHVEVSSITDATKVCENITQRARCQSSGAVKRARDHAAADHDVAPVEDDRLARA